MKPENISNAILILGCIFFIYARGFNIWLLLIILFGLATWGSHHYPKDSKDLIKAQLEQTKVKTDVMKAQIKLYAAQTFYYLKGKKIENG